MEDASSQSTESLHQSLTVPGTPSSDNRGSPVPETPSDEQFLNRFCHEGRVEEARTYLEDLKENSPSEIPVKLLQSGGLFGYTPLHESASEGRFDMIQMLLGFDQYIPSDNGYVNIKTNNGYSALHLAAAGGHTAVAKFLIEQGAELDCKDEFGKTPLGSSEIAARFETLRVMCSAAVLRAANQDDAPLMKMLFERSDLPVEPGCMQRALLVSVERDNPETVALMIEQGKRKKEISLEVALARSLEGRCHSARAMLLMLKAVKTRDYQLVLRLYGYQLSHYQNNDIQDPDFELVQKRVKAGKIPTEYAILQASGIQDSRVYEEILVRTKVDEEMKTVQWRGLRIESVKSSWLRRINYVEYFYLSYNMIRSLPDDVGTFLRNTKVINLEHNSLRSIPPALLELPSLKELNLMHNNITTLPKLQVWSPELQQLNLAHNKLHSLPAVVEAHRLKWLDLGHNQLSTHLECLGGFVRLEYLSLENNPAIERLPKEMGRLKDLHTLKLEGLGNLVDPPKLVAADLKACIGYLDECLKSAKPYYRMKLMFVGQAARGKTTFVKRLLGKKVKESDNQSTVGIEVNEWTCKGDAGPPIQFTLWDFGGQDVYYATHQCFLTKRSLYLLLWKMSDWERGIAELKPWLDNIAARVPGSRVVIIGTHYDRLSDEEKERVHDLLEEVGELAAQQTKLQIDKVTYVGLVEKINLDNVISSIYREARKYIEPEHFLKNPDKPSLLLERPVPASYQVVDEHLLSLHKKVKTGAVSAVMHGSEYKKMICSLKQADLYTDDDIHAATVFLHDLGSILHFNDRKNNLDDLYFIDPHWLFDMMSAIVTVSEKNPYIKHGVMETKCLDILYKDFMRGRNSGFLDQFVVLLDRFEVALPLDQHSLLITSMLPQSPPPDIDDPPDMVCRQRHLVFPTGHLTPPGFWSRFLARILHSVPCVKAVLDCHIQMEQQSSSQTSIEVSFESIYTGSWQHSLVPVGEPQRLDSITPMCSITDGESILKYWKSGMFYHRASHGVAVAGPEREASLPLFFRVEALEDIDASQEVVEVKEVNTLKEAPIARTGVCITTTPTAEGVQIYGHITDLCEKLLIEWFQGLMENTKHQIPCYSCLQEKLHPPALFQKDILMEQIDHTVKQVEIEDAGSGNDAFIVTCWNGHRISILDVAPDILLGDLHRDFLLPHSEVVFSEDKFLGKGGYGEVYLGTFRERDVAVKRYVKGVTEALKELRNEAIILQRCHHPSLAGMLGVVVELPHLALVLEYAPGGTLKTPLVKGSKPLPRILLFRMAAQVAAGLDFLHQMSYIYRDLKSDNILLWSMRLNNLVNCKVADFGLVIEAAPSGAKSHCGTAGFMAPEVVSSEHPAYDQSADTFSFGMVLYQMVARRNPYDFHNSKGPRKELINSAVEKGQLPKLDDVKMAKIGIPYLAMLMKQCWSYQPKNRPSMSNILPLLCNPVVQLTIGARSLQSKYSMRDACYRLHPTESPLQSVTHILDSIPPIEFWVCCDSAEGAELQVFNGENFRHLHTFQIGSNRQVKCMSFHNDFLWVASRDGLMNSSKVDVFNARSKSHAHSIRVSDCSPCCMSANKKNIFIGTLEGCVFMLTDDVQCELKNRQTRQKYLSEAKISGLQVVGRELWVSYNASISFHSSRTLKERGKEYLPVEWPHCVGQLALDQQGRVVWGVHVWGITVSAWDAATKKLIFVKNLQEVLFAEYPTETAVHKSLISAFCPVLDTIWCGLETGHILQFSTHGDTLAYFKLFTSYIRFLVPVPELGPCRSEKAMVLAGGKHIEKVGNLELEAEDDPLVQLIPPSPSGKQRKGGSTAEPEAPMAGTVLLMEAVSAYHAKQMEYLKRGRIWDSHRELQYFEQELSQFQHLRETESEPEFPPTAEDSYFELPTPSEVVKRYTRDKQELFVDTPSSSMGSASSSSSASSTSSTHPVDSTTSNLEDQSRYCSFSSKRSPYLKNGHSRAVEINSRVGTLRSGSSQSSRSPSPVTVKSPFQQKQECVRPTQSPTCSLDNGCCILVPERKRKLCQTSRRKASKHQVSESQSSGHRESSGRFSGHEENSGRFSGHEENGGASIGHEENGGASIGHEENGGASSGHEENGGASIGHQENGRASIGHEENGGASSGHQENGRASIGHQENGGVSIGHQENGGVSSGHEENGGESIGHQENGGESIGHQENGGKSIGHQENGGESIGHQENGGASIGHQENGGASIGHQENGGGCSGHQENGRISRGHNENDRGSSGHREKERGPSGHQMNAECKSCQNTEAADQEEWVMVQSSLVAEEPLTAGETGIAFKEDHFS